MSDAPSLPLKARLLSMGERTRALLEYHFDHDGKRLFTIAAEAEMADVVIIDHDHADARAVLAADTSHLTTAWVVLAFMDLQLDGVIIVNKPLSHQRLEAAAYEVLALRLSATPETNEAKVGALAAAPAAEAVPEAVHIVDPGTPKDTLSLPENAAQEVATAADTDADAAVDSFPDPDPNKSTEKKRSVAVRKAREEKRIELLCGPERDLIQLAPLNDPQHRYNPSRQLCALLSNTVADGDAAVEGLSLALSGIDIFVLPSMQKIYTTRTLKRASTVEQVFRQVSPSEVDVARYQAADIDFLIDRVKTEARYVYSSDAFSWLCALMSGRGRLPEGLSLDQRTRLRHWPNFTRLEITPKCMDIAFCWWQKPRSIAEVVTELDIQPRFVTAFCNGALALGLLKFESPAATESDTARNRETD